MFCTECGKPLRPGDKFCAQCGTPSAFAAVSSDASVRPPDRQDESRVPPSAVRVMQSTINLAPQPSMSGTASFQAAPVTSSPRVDVPLQGAGPSGSSERESSDASDRVPMRLSSVFSYRVRPNLTPEQVESSLGAAALPAENVQPLVVEIPPTPDSSNLVSSAKPVIATQTCPTCGALNGGGGKFCEACGGRLDPVAQIAASPYPARVSDVSPSPATSAPPPPIRSAFTDVAPVETESLPYATDLPETQGGSRAFWIIVAVLLLAGLTAIGWMLRSQSSSPAAAGSSQEGAISIMLAPALAKVAVGNGLDLTATLTGTNTPDVTWTVQENGAVGHVVPRGVLAKGGKLSATAVYVAGSTPGVYHVIVTSKADPSQSAVAEVTVTEASNSTQQ